MTAFSTSGSATNKLVYLPTHAHHNTVANEVAFTRDVQITRGNESVPKIIIDDTMNFFLKLQSAFL